MELIGKILIITGILSILKNYNNNIILLISLELIFIGISILFFQSSLNLDDFEGIVTAIFILCISATESALGLTLLVLLKKNY